MDCDECSAIKLNNYCFSVISVRIISSMYVRRTTIKSRKDGTQYYTYRLVESERTAKGVRQYTLLNLGSTFSLPREQWSELATRIQEILSGQEPLFEAPQEIEELAQNYAAQLIQAKKKVSEPTEPDYCQVDVDSMEVIRPRSISCEHVALEAFNSLGLGEHLKKTRIQWAAVSCGYRQHYWPYVPTGQ